jgi:hypothetical protein
MAFDEFDGPLVAVCGLAGGAATSTIALLLASQVAAASATPILLAEADQQRAGLAVITGRSTPRSLIALARELAQERAPTDTFVELEPGLRLIAAAPQTDPSLEAEALGSLLTQARHAHGLVVVDCATSWTADGTVLAHATDIIWTIPATPLGLATGQARLNVAPPPGRCSEILAATALTLQPRASVRALRKLAHRRCKQLVLIPHDDAIAGGHHTASDATRRSITAMASTLRRPR